MLSFGMAGKDHGNRCAPSSRVLLPTARRAAGFAPGSATRSLGREPETRRAEIAAPDSFDRSDTRVSADRFDPDTASLSHQTAALGLQRSGFEDLHKWGIPLRRWPTPAFPKAPGHPRAQHQP